MTSYESTAATPRPGRFLGKVALVTGAGAGIGAATALRLAEEGAHVVGNDVAEERLERTAAALLGNGHVMVPGDVSQEETSVELARVAVERWGRIDVLVNNAAIWHVQEVTETTFEDVARVLGINLYSMIWCCKHVIPTMLKQGSGAIVNVGSISAFVGQEQEGKSTYLYSITKAGAVQLTRSLATRYAADGIRVNAVCPGMVHTDMLGSVYPQWSPQEQWDAMEEGGRDLTPIGRAAQSEELAAAIAFLASDEASIIVGAILMADGGFLVR
jgi:NAD(P)-dependent dehydrogenase (short-subunit alcohol dehydrogenase family)